MLRKPSQLQSPRGTQGAGPGQGHAQLLRYTQSTNRSASPGMLQNPSQFMSLSRQGISFPKNWMLWFWD